MDGKLLRRPRVYRKVESFVLKHADSIIQSLENDQQVNVDDYVLELVNQFDVYDDLSMVPYVLMQELLSYNVPWLQSLSDSKRQHVIKTYSSIAIMGDYVKGVEKQDLTGMYDDIYNPIKIGVGSNFGDG